MGDVSRISASSFRVSCSADKLYQTLATSRTAAHQDLLSMGFPRQESWSGLPFPPPGDVPTQGSKSCLLHWPMDSLPLSHQGALA